MIENPSARFVSPASERPHAVATPKRRAADEARMLSRILDAQADIANAGLDPRAVVEVIVARAQQLTRSAGAVVELLDDDAMVYWVANGTAAKQVGLRLDARTSLSGMSVRTGRILRCDDAETDPRVDREACRKVGLRSMLVVPLRHAGLTVGVLKVISPVPGFYGREDVRALDLMATLVAASLAHALEHTAMLHELRARKDREEQDALDRDEVVARIRRTIDRNEMRMAFQPIVNLTSGRVVGYEALARFGGREMMATERWFADARNAGLGDDLEFAAVARALVVLDHLPGDAYLSVNVSPVALGGEVGRLLDRPHADRVVIEVTEHTSVHDYEQLVPVLDDLRDRGVRVAIDDAGAGFASLRHIVRLQPDLIKLDASLTQGIDREGRLRTLASALLLFAANTDAAIIAEGVETAGELGTLRELGVPFGQGYFLGRPQMAAAARAV